MASLAILLRSSTVEEIGSAEPVRNVVWALFFALGCSSLLRPLLLSPLFSRVP